MKYQFSLTDLSLAPITSILIATIGICSYWSLFVSTKFKASCLNKQPGDEGTIAHILILKYAGLVMLGIVPYWVFTALVPQYNWKSLGIGFNGYTSLTSLGWIALFCVPVLLLVRYTARKPANCEHYPQIRVEAWDLRLMIRYSFAWGMYLLGYEFLFRGILLFPLVDSFGVWLAIAINTALYAASHLPKGGVETFLAMIFGPVFCLITLQTETIWAAWIIHSILAIANSMFALKYHPTFFIVRNRKPMSDECEI